MSKMFIGILTCSYEGTTSLFMDGKYFDDEETLKTVHKNSNYYDSELEVRELTKAPDVEEMPVHYALCLVVGKLARIAHDWDTQGQSKGGMYMDVPKDVRDAAMAKIQAKYPKREFVWVERYQV